jgi:hypothetical protein
MVTNGDAQAESGILNIFLDEILTQKNTHTISVLKHVFHDLTLFSLQTACKFKTACRD